MQVFFFKELTLSPYHLSLEKKECVYLPVYPFHVFYFGGCSFNLEFTVPHNFVAASVGKLLYQVSWYRFHRVKGIEELLDSIREFKCKIESIVDS